MLVLRSDQNNREVVEIAQKLSPPSVFARIAEAFEVDEPTGDPRTPGRNEAYSIDSLALSGDGRTLAAAGWFGGSELFVFGLGARPRAMPVKKPRDAFRALAVSPDGKLLFGATRSAIVRMPTRRLEGFACVPLDPRITRPVGMWASDQIQRYGGIQRRCRASFDPALAFRGATLVRLRASLLQQP